MTAQMIRRATGTLGLLAASAMLTSTISAQRPPDIGIAPVSITAPAYTFDTAEQHQLHVAVIARGLPHPFSLAFLPSGDALVTERGGRLRVIHGATSASPALDPTPVAGAPQTVTFRGGGLQDVALHPKFAENGLVYFTYNKKGDPTQDPERPLSAVAIARGRFDGKAIVDLEEIFVGDWRPGNSGSRMAFGLDGLLYVTAGGPGGDFAQRLDTVYGKVLRLKDDGTIPADNPFAGQAGKRPEIFSYGHRDHLGLTVQPGTGAILNAEHGPNGGDEVNIILAGRNYGWPKYTFGRDYPGPRLTESPTGPGIEPPAILWIPSIAPGNLTFYSGTRFANWKGNLFVASARRGEVPRTGGIERVVLNDKLEEVRRESLLGDLHQRFHDIRQGPDGLLYAVTDEDDGVVLRLEPSNRSGT